MHPRPERLAVVLGEKAQGSGYLLAPGVVITSGHVVGDASTARVALLNGSGVTRCRVLWARQDDKCDAALLLAEGGPLTTLPLGNDPVWADATEPTPWQNAQCLGFPAVERDELERPDTKQVVGTFNPGTGMKRGYAVLELPVSSSGSDGSGGSPWAGLSGAPVFVNGQIVGLVRHHRPGQPGTQDELILTPTATLMREKEFERARLQHRVKFRVLELTTQPARPESSVTDLQEQYEDYVKKHHGQLDVIGALLEGPHWMRRWPLATGYLSLSLQEPPGGTDTPPLTSSPLERTEGRRAAQALSGIRRALIFGPAGSGKTTLLQWLAVSAAGGDLPAELVDLKDRVPFLMSVGSLMDGQGDLPTSDGILMAAARLLASDRQAAGWVHSLLRNGRCLLLLDGIDEIPQASRIHVKRWLKEILEAFPETAVLLTTRPSAVAPDWLSDLDFRTFAIQPMDHGQVSEFIARWHAAVSECAGDHEHERLAGYRDGLQSAVLAKPDLGKLATNPLLCALICALNHDRHGCLPKERMELYRAALEMLLHRRDFERTIQSPTDASLGKPNMERLLQQVAYWLARNNALELTRERALDIISDLLPRLRLTSGNSEQVLDHLLQRSGVLRQTSPGTLGFIHRTFQDYLAAQAAVADGSLGELVKNAHDDQWGDIVRMAVTHARPHERVDLIVGLLSRAEADPVHADRLRVVAATCLEYAPDLDPRLEQRVSDEIASLVPPTSRHAARSLARVGPPVLDLLPGPDGLADDEARAVVGTALLVADDRAIPLLAKYAQHADQTIIRQLAEGWPNFDTYAYGANVISVLASSTAEVPVVVTQRDHVEYLAQQSPPAAIECRGPYPFDLDMLTRRGETSVLLLTDCTGPVDLRGLAGRSLERLAVRNCPDLRHPEAVAEMTRLGTLACDQPLRSAGIQLPPALRRLEIRGPSWPLDLASCTDLSELVVDAPYFLPPHRKQVQGCASIQNLTILRERLATLPLHPVMDHVRRLTLVAPYNIQYLRGITACYPTLHELVVQVPAGSEHAVIPPDLHEWAVGCRVTIETLDAFEPRNR